MALEGCGGPKGVPEGGTGELLDFVDVVGVNILNEEGDDGDRNKGDEPLDEIGHDNGDNVGVIPSEGKDEDDLHFEGDSDDDDEEGPYGDEGLPSFMLGETYANKKDLVAAINTYT
ncbi:hypothetical protein QN277_019835 [Acacia crassicarpa]|uniref:Uncharacterized protein n=1 Tax=Acacia crassicarpa TaxID=499986 RepID=A0AAE1JN74_9FABA|nr:hypothetical protein QN277_019835 [Acacia crassicarpa]